MKSIYIIVILLAFGSLNLFAQRTNASCGTSLDPINATEELRRMAEYNQNLDRILNQKNARAASISSNDQFILIPVVFHVVWKTADQNVSDAQLCDLLRIINEDYSRTNPDRSDTPAAFQPNAGNPKIQFYLTNRDGNGNVTTGITRTQTTKDKFITDNDEIMSGSSGGKDGWDKTKFLNVWICGPTLEGNDGKQVQGYGVFPSNGGKGVVVRSNSLSSPQHIPTHEIGHWLGLKHIWGDGFSETCNDSDDVGDTPNQFKASQFRKLTDFPLTDACTSGYPGIMFMNFMDYSNEMNFFTNGQVARMRANFAPGGAYSAYTFANTGYQVLGNEAICTSATYSFAGTLPTGLSVSWSTSNPSGLSINSSGVATRQSGFNGEVTVIANINGGSLCNSTKISKKVFVGPAGTISYGLTSFDFIGSSAGAGVCNSCGNSISVLLKDYGSTATYVWGTPTKSGSVSSGASGRNLSATLGPGASLSIPCTINNNNTCQVTFSFYNYSSSFRAVLYPNPVSDKLSVEAVPVTDYEFTESRSKMETLLFTDDLKKAEVLLLDLKGNIIFKKSFTGTKMDFDTKKIPNGTYFLHIGKGESSVKRQIQILH